MATEGRSIRVTGAEDLHELAQALKEAGNRELRRDLLAGIRRTVRPIIPEIPAHAAAILPRRGGLAELYSHRKIAVRTTLGKRSAAVRLVSTSPGRLRDVNAGKLRHPRWGDKKHWYAQSVPEGWFSDPIQRRAADVRAGIQKVMRNTAAKIEGSVR